MVSAKLSSELIARVVPDYSRRVFYVSGPDAMVTSAKEILQSMGVGKRNIKTDHFSGY